MGDGFEFDPQQAQEAEALLRQAANDAHEAGLESGSALSSVHPQEHAFGTTPEGESTALKWDEAANARAAEANKVSTDADALADAIADSSNHYRDVDTGNGDTFDQIGPR